MWLRAVLVFVMIASLGGRGVAGPLLFEADFPRVDGTIRMIEFSGELTDNGVSGRLVVDGHEVDVIGEVTKHSISGRFKVGGQEVGHFVATVIDRALYGSHSLNGEIGRWTIPLRDIPKEARDVRQRGEERREEGNV
jgi:hypothetical protein